MTAFLSIIKASYARYALFGAVLLCLGIACEEDDGLGSLTKTTYDGNPDIFMMGQSNANDDLAAEIAKASGKTIHQISHGGQAIHRWFEDPYNWLESDMAFLGNRTFQYFIWFQGESNLTNRAKYEDMLKQIIEAASPSTAPVVIIVGVWVSDPDPAAFRNYQMAMCDRNENFYFVDSMGCERSDGVHLTRAGQQLLARRISNLIVRLESDIESNQ
ncbi:MAG: hypothetical protein JXX14_18150 [Deltaproteobacteria bacterium]|nr:hypothetical protein [Deltaproteobacteria bacterium]